MSLFPVFFIFRIVPDGVFIDDSLDELLVQDLGSSLLQVNQLTHADPVKRLGKAIPMFL